MNKIHISLNVTDVEKSQKFYETFLESPAHKVRPGYANFDLTNPPLKLAIQERMSLQAGEGKVSHLGIQVPTGDDVEAAIDRLSDAGFHLKEEKDEVWVQDPDGNRWEVYTITDEMESVEESSCLTNEKQVSCC